MGSFIKSFHVENKKVLKQFLNVNKIPINEIIASNLRQGIRSLVIPVSFGCKEDVEDECETIQMIRSLLNNFHISQIDFNLNKYSVKILECALIGCNIDDIEVSKEKVNRDGVLQHKVKLTPEACEHIGNRFFELIIMFNSTTVIDIPESVYIEPTTRLLLALKMFLSSTKRLMINLKINNIEYSINSDVSNVYITGITTMKYKDWFIPFAAFSRLSSAPHFSLVPIYQYFHVKQLILILKPREIKLINYCVKKYNLHIVLQIDVGEAIKVKNRDMLSASIFALSYFKQNGMLLNLTGYAKYCEIQELRICLTQVYSRAPLPPHTFFFRGFRTYHIVRDTETNDKFIKYMTDVLGYGIY